MKRLLGGCLLAVIVVEELAVAGPIGPEVLTVGAVVPGQQVPLAVSGATPGATVVFATSTAGPGAGPCHPGLGVCLDLLSPTVLGNVVVAGNGTALLSLPVPAGAPGVTLYTQAVVLDGSATVTNTVTSVVQAVDNDGDGHSAPSDCDDDDPNIHGGAPEACDGADQDCDGVVDDAPSCWVAVYRFHDRATGARCWNTDITPPPACATYAYEIEAWIVPSQPVPGTYEARQCSYLTDHIVVEYGSADYRTLVASGHDCSVALGHPYDLGAGPPEAELPFANKCPLYRFTYPTPGGGAHLFTRGADNLGGMTCEPPARGEVLTDFSCFAGPPAGC